MEGKTKKEPAQDTPDASSTTKKPSTKTKESEHVKREKISATPPPAEKKAVKRTRASTAPGNASSNETTPKVTPKRRRV